MCVPMNPAALVTRTAIGRRAAASCGLRQTRAAVLCGLRHTWADERTCFSQAGPPQEGVQRERRSAATEEGESEERWRKKKRPTTAAMKERMMSFWRGNMMMQDEYDYINEICWKYDI